jgi:hypothetical protein
MGASALTKKQIKDLKLTTSDLVKIVNLHIDKFKVFSPPNFDDVTHANINGFAVQLNVEGIDWDKL